MTCAPQPNFNTSRRGSCARAIPHLFVCNVVLGWQYDRHSCLPSTHGGRDFHHDRHEESPPTLAAMQGTGIPIYTLLIMMIRFVSCPLPASTTPPSGVGLVMFGGWLSEVW
jgi:hypothetical protein